MQNPTDTPAPRSLADKVEWLFQNHTGPDGNRYTLREVEEGSARTQGVPGHRISASSLRKIRQGQTRNPGYRAVLVLARFFGVPVTWLMADADGQEGLRCQPRGRTDYAPRQPLRPRTAARRAGAGGLPVAAGGKVCRVPSDLPLLCLAWPERMDHLPEIRGLSRPAWDRHGCEARRLRERTRWLCYTTPHHEVPGSGTWPTVRFSRSEGPMAHELTLTIPDALYQRLESAAQEAQDDVAAVALSALENAFPAFPAHPERAQMQAEVAAYEAMHPELRATHLGQYVAIHQGRLVDWDADPIALHERITERFPNQVVLCRQVRQEPERVLHFRSFHFERPLNNRSTGRV